MSCWPLNQSINQSTNQSINQLINLDLSVIRRSLLMYVKTVRKKNLTQLIHKLHVKLMLDLFNKNKIDYHNSKEHLQISKIAKRGRQMLLNIENVA